MQQEFKLPAPSQLNATNDCELIAVLITLGFDSPDNALTVARGDGIEGRRGYWRFLPELPGHPYSLKQALKHGTHPRLAERPGAYRPQAYMAACLHNYRMLIEQVQHGTSLLLQKCGYLWLLQRAGNKVPPTRIDAQQAPAVAHARTAHTALVAGLATLGFEPLPEASTSTTAISHGRRPLSWHIPHVSSCGRFQRDEVCRLWEDEEWCARFDNDSPIAAMSDCMHNLRFLRDSLRGADEFIRVQHGRRSAWIRKDASQSAWDKAEAFLLK